MAFQIFNIPVACADSSCDRLNNFLQTHSIVSVRKDLLQQDAGSFFVFLVEFSLAGTGTSPDAGKKPYGDRIDYRAVLSETDFKLNARLRDLRKQLGEEKALPIFAIGTNKQLADIAVRKPRTLAAFKNIEGIGKQKLADYGQRILDIVNTFLTECPALENAADASVEQSDEPVPF